MQEEQQIFFLFLHNIIMSTWNYTVKSGRQNRNLSKNIMVFYIWCMDACYIYWGGAEQEKSTIGG